MNRVDAVDVVGVVGALGAGHAVDGDAIEASDAVAPGAIDRYRLVGPVYDAFAALASGSAIHRCRLAALDHIRPGDRVLFVGPGHGSDVAAAISAGARVTVVERSATMLRRLGRTLARHARPPPTADGMDTAPTIIHGDAFDHDGADYDVVVANFFLNVFDVRDEDRMVRHLVARLKPGGILVVGDFAFVGDDDHRWFRALSTVHWYLATVVFSLLTGNAVRPMTDHGGRAASVGLRLLSTTSFSAWGLPLYASVAMVRDARDA